MDIAIDINIDIDIDIDIDSLFHLDNTLSYGNGASHRLDKQSLQDTPACSQLRQGNKITNKQCMQILL